MVKSTCASINTIPIPIPMLVLLMGEKLTAGIISFL